MASVFRESLPKFDGTEGSFNHWRLQFESYVRLVSKDCYKLLLAGAAKDFEVGMFEPSEDDLRLYSYLYLALDKNSAMLVKSMCCGQESGAAAWHVILSDFASRSVLHHNQIREQLHTMKLRDGDDACVYATKVISLATQLKECGSMVSDEEVIGALLRGLPESYREFRMICSLNPCSLSETVLRLRTVARERSDRHAVSTPTPSAFVAEDKRQKKKTVKCWRCHKMGHVRKDCRVDLNKNRSNRNGQPADNSFVSVAFTIGSQVPVDSWVIDSGCSTHMTGSRELFSSLSPYEGSVRAANGENLSAIGRGNVVFDCKSVSDGDVHVTLSDVLYVPRLKYNLVSVSCLIERGGSFEVKLGSARITLGNVALPVKMTNNTFVLSMNKAENALLADGSTSVSLWHRRLAHASSEAVKAALKQQNLDFKDDSDVVCKPCVLSNMKRPSYPKTTTNSAKKPKERCNVDLFGPMPVTSVDGYVYGMTIVDEFSRMSFMFTLKKKSDAAPVFDTFLEQFGPFEVVRSDRGGEFCGNSFEEVCRKWKIKREYTAANAPQQNGKVERKIAVLMERTRAMLCDCGLPKEMWSHAMRYACYVLNRTPSRVIGGKTPCEMFSGEKSSLSLIRVFGCVAYVKEHGKVKEKLAPRARELFFVGVPAGTKGYLLFDPSTKKVSVSRDVIFDESARMPDYRDLTVDEGEMSLPPEEIEVNPGPAIAVVPRDVVENSEHDDVLQQVDDIEPELVEQGTVVAGRRVVGISRSGRNIYEPERFYEANLTEHFVLSGLVTPDPATYEEAIKGPDSEMWVQAMHEELNSLEKNGTFEYTSLPRDRKAIGCKWVFKTKMNADGSVSRYKARLVARGFTQVPGIDYDETFSPVARLTSIRVVLSIASAKSLIVHHVDIKSAYLQAELDEEIYMKIPPGVSGQTGKVWRLKKGLYGLKQSGRNWHNELVDSLGTMGFKKADADPCLFVNQKSGMFVLVYVDDLLICANDVGSVNSFKACLAKHYDTTDLGALNWYLGMHVKQQKDGNLKLSQELYVESLLKRFGLKEAGVMASPAAELRLSPAEGSEKVMSHVPYRELAGSLMWLSVCCRPDITYAVNAVCRFVEKPAETHWKAAKRILRYVKGTLNQGLLFRKGGDMKLVGFTDSDWAGDSSRKSTSGYVFLLNGTPVSWSSRLQKNHAMSTAEAEYVAGCDAGLEAVYLRRLLCDLSFPQSEPTVIYQDNKAAIDMSKNPVKHKSMKHIELRVNKIRELVDENVVQMKWISTDHMLADIFTKPLGFVKHEKAAKMLLSQQ